MSEGNSNGDPPIEVKAEEPQSKENPPQEEIKENPPPAEQGTQEKPPEQEKSPENVIKEETKDEGPNAKANKPILKKAGAKAKKHIIDELNMNFDKHATIALLNCTTPPAKLSQSSQKDFIKKNIQRSAAVLSQTKAPIIHDESKINELLEESNKKISKTVDVNQRFYKKAEDYKKKNEELKEKMMKEQLDACTFKPKTNTKKEAKQNPKDFNKKLDDYIEKKKKRQEDAMVESKKNQEKQDNPEELTYKPKICEKSKEILSKKVKDEVPIHERLYNQSKTQAHKQLHEIEVQIQKEPKEKENKEKDITNDVPEIIPEGEKPIIEGEEAKVEIKDSSKESSSIKDKELLSDPNKTVEEQEVFFRPTINPKSKNLARQGKIENILYEDALRRKNKTVNTQNSPQTKFLTSNSEKFLAEKFKRDFNDCLAEIQTEDSSKLNYNQLLDISRSLYFIREEKEEVDRITTMQIWRLFSEDEAALVSKESVLAVLLGVMGLWEEWMESESIQVKISKEETIKLHKKYKQLYTNRCDVTNKSTINQTFKNLNEPTFQPEMIAQSNELAEKWRSAHREPGKIEDNLLSEQSKKEKKIQQLKQKAEAEQLKECSFKPKTEELPSIYTKSTHDYSKLGEGIDPRSTHKGVILYNLAEKNKEKKEQLVKTSKEKQEKEDLEECTFAPKVLEKNPGNINDFVQRMQAREELKEKKSISSPKELGKGAKIVKSPRSNRKTSPKKVVEEGKNLESITEAKEDKDISPNMNLNEENNVKPQEEQQKTDDASLKPLEEPQKTEDISSKTQEEPPKTEEVPKTEENKVEEPPKSEENNG
ncbi:hypothetical protein SteCoe_7742 [Stentor coeruleus]|uniref:Uncharacterized protein n=1 Tax=Stentor coeruleus TaxID=5963 RepID=A0A1R2CLR8_9CILI|nr:hypothetical protein SteCoe_7742 [Stentor coeruleus]